MFTTGFQNEQGSWVGEVIDVALPLVKVRRGWAEDGEEIILNTAAFDFSKAIIRPHRSPEEKAKSRHAWETRLAPVKAPLQAKMETVDKFEKASEPDVPCRAKAG